MQLRIPPTAQATLPAGATKVLTWSTARPGVVREWRRGSFRRLALGFVVGKFVLRVTDITFYLGGGVTLASKGFGKVIEVNQLLAKPPYEYAWGRLAAQLSGCALRQLLRPLGLAHELRGSTRPLLVSCRFGSEFATLYIVGSLGDQDIGISLFETQVGETFARLLERKDAFRGCFKDLLPGELPSLGG